MAKPRSRMADFAVYFAIRVVFCVVQALAWPQALQLAAGLAWLGYRVNRRHRLVAIDNIRHAFPDLDADAVDRLVRASYLHFTTMVVEMIRMPRVLNARNLADYIEHADAANVERLTSWVRCGKPLLALTGHFGNWELLSHVTGLFGAHGAIVARRLDNPYLDRFVTRFRCQNGQTMLDKSADYARILEHLAGGGALGMVGDQDAGPRGLFVSFLGRPASTFKSIALLSLEYGAPIIVEGAARIGHPLRYRIYVEDVILPEEYAQRPDATRAITQRYTDALERMVRRHPEQYFWLHRRWKHQPPVKKAKQAA